MVIAFLQAGLFSQVFICELLLCLGDQVPERTRGDSFISARCLEGSASGHFASCSLASWWFECVVEDSCYSFLGGWEAEKGESEEVMRTCSFKDITMVF